ncbi:MAG: NTP transferase domain-containing protein [Thermoplasmatales archaeon]|nr:MAG: NTP transferase domain-containing protein [Thermoplasmatales archaeon]
MNNSWFVSKNLKCIVLCAGSGKRITPHSKETPKVMIEIEKKPILGYIIDYWNKYTNEFIFVVGYKKEQVIEYVNNLPIKAKFVEQKELNGIADALSYVEELVSDNFIVVLGDCIYKGEFHYPKDMKQGIGVRKTEDIEDIKGNYSVEIKNGFICKVIEKPKKVVNDLCGMGFYFFNKKVFDYIRITKPSKLRNEIEITDVIQNMIDAGEKIKPSFFKGKYINITFPEDIKKAKNLLFNLY